MTFGAYVPPHNTEVDEAAVRDCGGSSGLMLANKATLGAWPNTRAEREALLRDCGTMESHEGVSVLTLREGMTRHFGWIPAWNQTTGAGMLDGLRIGTGAALFGYYSAFSTYFSRWDRNFAAKGDASYHVVYVQREPSSALRILDPLCPHANWQGELIAARQLVAFATAYGSPARLLTALEGEHVGSSNTTQQSEGYPMIQSGGLSLGSDHVVDVPAGTDYFDGPGGDHLGSIGPVTLDYYGLWDNADGDHMLAVEIHAPTRIVAIAALPRRAKTAAELAAQAQAFGGGIDCEGPIGAALEDYRARVLAVPTRTT